MRAKEGPSKGLAVGMERRKTGGMENSSWQGFQAMTLCPQNYLENRLVVRAANGETRFPEQ